RAEALSAIHWLSAPPETSSRRATRTPSESNGRDLRPRRRNGSSTIVTPLPKTGLPSLSCRKLIFRAIDDPEIAPAKWPSRLDDTRGSNSTGYLPSLGRDGLSRATALSPALRPISAAESRFSRYRAL